jgi:hypothetical protein
LSREKRDSCWKFFKISGYCGWGTARAGEPENSGTGELDILGSLLEAFSQKVEDY